MQPSPYAAPTQQAPVDVRSKVALPAILILVTECIGIVMQLLSFVFRDAILAAVTEFVNRSGQTMPAASMQSNPVMGILSLLGGGFWWSSPCCRCVS